MRSNLNSGGARVKFLRKLYQWFPFDIRGGLFGGPSRDCKPIISCLICASQRPKELDDLLFDLSRQRIGRERYEVVVLNDGGGEVIRRIAEKYKGQFNLIYQENDTSRRFIGQLRNATISMSTGQYLLFLDDDTRILQEDFLEKAMALFDKNNVDVIIPEGRALYGIVKIKHDYFDRYSFGNAGCLYTRNILEKVGGFRNDLPSYEDIELGIRLNLINATMLITDELVYFHPPFYFPSMQKPISIGKSILKLRRHYSWPVWLVVFLNALRFLPYGLVPDSRYQQWFKISLGVLWACFKKEEYYY